QVPQREVGMTPYEMMLSESQERMLMVLRPGSEDQARAVFEKWGLDFAIIGTITDTKRMVVTHAGDVVADLPIDPLAQASPEYDEKERPYTPAPKPEAVSADDVPAPNDPMAALEKLLGCPDLSAKRWIWDQYDHMVMADTIHRPGGDAAVVRVHGTEKALAITTDCTPRYC
ncbi:MAG: AIR synthase-related protein, partial [Alphaproteobacteria bacterium]|nr:AIR synthase-related protein [Alphaproteobacteria bacterium]